MFSFHKPKVYRSTQGCCICKAKSSSSRFTDSKKYEEDFLECFQLLTPRCGEICNACVLLVKRFKRLPPGSERHWSHVVDARIGPGIKSMNKFKKRKEEQQNGNGFERFETFPKKLKKKRTKEIITNDKNTSQMDCSSPDENSEPNGQCDIEMNCLKENSDDDDDCIDNTKLMKNQIYDKQQFEVPKQRINRKSKCPLKNRSQKFNQMKSIIDHEQWTKIKSCCGFIYENKSIGAVLIDLSILTPHNCTIHNINYTTTERINNDKLEITNVQKTIVLKTLPLKKQHSLGKRYIEQQTVDAIGNSTIPINAVDSHQMQIKINGNKNVHLINDYGKKSNKIIDALSVTKFNDNSSDSGYDETLHDTAQLNHIAKVGATRPVILSNGVKIHVQPQNLLLAANLAGVSKTAIQTTQAFIGQQKNHHDQAAQHIRGQNAITNGLI